MEKPVNVQPIVGTCPACGTKLRFQAEPKLGEFVVCEECGTELEVIQLSPIKLDWAFEEPFDEEYDDDDDWDFDDEEYEEYDDDDEYDDYDDDDDKDW